MTKYVKGWVACIENKDGSRFPNGSLYLYSEPHPTEKQAQDWAWAHDSISGCNLIRIECNDVPEARLVRPLPGFHPAYCHRDRAIEAASVFLIED